MDVANPLIKHSLVSTINAKRAMGVADEQIAYMLNLAPTQVRAIPYPTPNVHRSRSVQHMQLSVMAGKLMPAVEQGDRDAILTMLKVQQREANLLGLDAPKEVISHNFNATLDVEGMTPEQIKDLPTADLKAMVLRSALSRGDTVEVPDAARDPAP